MFTKIYWIHELNNLARLGIMARPRGNEWLTSEINNLKKQNVGVLVSLLEPEEIKDLELEKQSETCKIAGINYINFPIADRDIPKTSDNLDNLISCLTGTLNAGISVVIHCRMGIGRSSIIAASVLLKQGFKADDIIHNIKKARGLKVPDTEQQLAWLKARQ